MPRQSAVAQLPPPNLVPSLDNLNVEDLMWYGATLPGAAPTRKADLVAYVADALRDPDRLRSLWSQLSAGQQQVIAEILHNLEGKYDADVLTAKYPQVAPPARMTRYSMSSWDMKRSSATPFDFFFF